MLRQPLTKATNFYRGILPPIYSDHTLFSETLQQPYHCLEHSSALGLLLTQGGNCNYYINGTKNQVNGNKMIFVNRQSKLAIKISEKNAIPVLLFFNSGLPDLVWYSLSNRSEKLLDENTSHIPGDFSYLERIHDRPQLHHTISMLISLGNSCSSFASLKADIIIRNLFECLLEENRQALKLSQNLNVIKPSTRLEIFKRISFAREWMEENHSKHITLEEIASVVAMNSQHFLRMFRQIYQITPYQYLKKVRLAKAKDLLTSTDLPVTEICDRIGFESVYSFSSLFKNFFGSAPSYFRNQN